MVICYSCKEVHGVADHRRNGKRHKLCNFCYEKENPPPSPPFYTLCRECNLSKHYKCQCNGGPPQSRTLMPDTIAEWLAGPPATEHNDCVCQISKQLPNNKYLCNGHIFDKCIIN